MYTMVAFVHAVFLTLRDRIDRLDRTDDRGQATAEYALILVAAATLGIIVLAWMAGDGRKAVGDVLAKVFDKIKQAVG